MKYTLFSVVLIALTLTACGEPKPGQYPPGFMDRELLSDADLEKTKQEAAAAKQSAPEADASESEGESGDEDETETSEKRGGY